MNPHDYTRTPHGDCFVKPHLRKGLLPLILEEIISARKKFNIYIILFNKH